MAQKDQAGAGFMIPGWCERSWVGDKLLYLLHSNLSPTGDHLAPRHQDPDTTPSLPWSHQAMFSSKDVQGRPPTPAIETVKPSGYPSKAGPQPVDDSKTPISGQGHRRYPCHPPWHSPPGVGLRSPQRPIQGQGIGRAGRAIKPLR